MVRGFEQHYQLDYDQTFASVVKPMSYKIIFSLAAIHNWEIEHMDIKTAFLYNKIDEKVYIEQLTGFTKDNQVFYLKKTLYSLKQLPQIWYTKIATFLTEQGYKATDANHAVFTKNEDSIAFYIDNLLLCDKAGLGLGLGLGSRLGSRLGLGLGLVLGS